MDTTKEQESVLASLLSSSPEEFSYRMSIALKQIDGSFFSERCKVIYKVLCRFYLLTRQKIGWEKLEQALKVANVSDADIVEYNLLFNNLSSSSDTSLLFNIELLKEITRQENLTTYLIHTMEILKEGKKIGRKELVGYNDSRSFLTQSLAKLDKVDGVDSPDGDVNVEGDLVLKEYAKSKVEKTHGTTTGVLELDALTGGLKPGEFALVAGYAGDCKTTTCINIAHHMAYVLKKNVVYATGETLRTQVRRKMVCRRSRDNKYGYREGLPYKEMELGDLSAKEEQVLKNVVSDMGSSDYGKFMVFQFPPYATVEYVKNRLALYETEFSVDAIFIDEARLLSSSRARSQTWEEMDDVLKGLKQLAVTFNHGNGVSVISPYQVTRKAWEEAQKEHSYKKSCLANSSEAERSADLVFSLFREPSRTDEIKGKVLKYRDGGEGEAFTLDISLNHCFVGTHIGGS